MLKIFMILTSLALIIIEHFRADYAFWYNQNKDYIEKWTEIYQRRKKRFEIQYHMSSNLHVVLKSPRSTQIST